MEEDEYTELMRRGCLTIIVALLLVLLLAVASCRTPKSIIDTRYVYDTTYVSRVDSIYKHDSIVREKETIVMQLDSAAMAEYGIRMKSAEVAWLVKTRELASILTELKQIKADSAIHTRKDTVFITDPIIKYVEKDLSPWQLTQIYAGRILLAFVALYLLYILWRYRKIFSNA